MGWGAVKSGCGCRGADIGTGCKSGDILLGLVDCGGAFEFVFETGKGRVFVVTVVVLPVVGEKGWGSEAIVFVFVFGIGKGRVFVVTMVVPAVVGEEGWGPEAMVGSGEDFVRCFGFRLMANNWW